MKRNQTIIILIPKLQKMNPIQRSRFVAYSVQPLRCASYTRHLALVNQAATKGMNFNPNETENTTARCEHVAARPRICIQNCTKTEIYASMNGKCINHIHYKRA